MYTLLNQRILEMEQETSHLQTQVQFKDAEIESLKDTLKQAQVELSFNKPKENGDEHHLFKLDDITKLETDLRMKESEVVELGQDLMQLRQQKDESIHQLTEQLEEYKELYRSTK